MNTKSERGEMQAVMIDQQVTRSAMTRTAERVVELIRSLSGDTDVAVPRSEWTVGQAAAHLLVVCRVFTDAAEAHEGRWLPYVPDMAEWRQRLAMFNERTIAHVMGDTDGLADELATAMRAFLTATDGRSGDDRLGTPWYGTGATLTLDAVNGLVLGELTLHGYDMARAVGISWPLDPEHARLIIGGVFPAMIPLIAKPDAIRSVTASYDISVRGGPRFVVAFERGQVCVEPFTSQRVDCHIQSDPVTWLLVGYGRVPQWGPIARGRLRAWGRRPWLGPRFKGLLSNP